MKIEDLVLSIDQMNHLKELGLNIKDTAIVYLYFDYDINNEELARPHFRHYLCESDVFTPTLTLEEILNILPKEIIMKNTNNEKIILTLGVNKEMIWYEDIDSSPIVFKYDSALESAYNMLCWIIKHEYLKI